jgi:D-glycero-alpha-D-manno-heptose 1-phosphate guanylyltransferase
MEAIILAGGFGTRLQSVVKDLPKPMAPVAGRPFLAILMSHLRKKGVTRFILSVGYKADKIQSAIGAVFEGVPVVYEVESIPLGTGGAIKAAMKHVSEDHVFVLNGDTYLDFDLLGAESLWQRLSIPLMVARKVPDTFRYGALSVKNHRIIGFLEKGVSGPGFINGGCYLLPSTLFQAHALPDSFSFETDFLPNFIQKNTLNAFVSEGYFIDIGVPEDYQRAQIELAR